MCEPLSRERDADHETEYETRSSLSAAPGTKGEKTGLYNNLAHIRTIHAIPL